MEIFILEAQEIFPGTLKVNMMNVLYFFVIYRLYLNCNAKLTAERQVINYRHKISQQFYSNTDVLSENLLLEKSKELLKINLIFRACLLAESFLLKLNKRWLFASNLIISTKTWRKTPISRFPEIMQATTRIEIHSIFFCEVCLYLISKCFKKWSLIESLFY